MSARTEVLAKIRAAKVPRGERLPAARAQSDGGVAELAARLGDVGGAFIETTESGVAHTIAGLPFVTAVRNGWSESPELLPATVTRISPASVGEWLDVDLAVIEARFAVSETGSIWFGDDEGPVRAAAFAPEHVVFVLTPESVLSTLDELFERLQAAGASPGGVLISGPSKTADIEQTLVIGAQGPRSLTVLLVSRSDS